MTGGDAATVAESKDSLCMLAVKNSLAENQNKFKEDAANYNFHPKNNEFLQSVSIWGADYPLMRTNIC